MIYKIPLWKREIQLDHAMGGPMLKCIQVDSIGIFIHYAKEEQLDPDHIRRHIIGRHETWAMIEADSAGEAIQRFYDEWDGAKTGADEHPEQKALWIDTEREILEYPPCARQHKNKNGEWVCGEPDKEEESEPGEFGGCCIEGFDEPEELDCPIGKYNDEFYIRKYEKGNLPIRMIRGFKVAVINVIKPRLFTMKADVEFEAMDLDHAHERLEDHFKSLGTGENSKLAMSGKIEIKRNI